MRQWRNGRRASLRGWWPKGRGGSSPLCRTMDARREWKPRTKAHTEYDTALVCFSGSNPDASTNTVNKRCAVVGRYQTVMVSGNPVTTLLNQGDSVTKVYKGRSGNFICVLFIVLNGPLVEWKTRTFQRRNFPGSTPGWPTKYAPIC